MIDCYKTTLGLRELTGLPKRSPTCKLLEIVPEWERHPSLQRSRRSSQSCNNLPTTTKMGSNRVRQTQIQVTLKSWSIPPSCLSEPVSCPIPAVGSWKTECVFMYLTFLSVPPLNEASDVQDLFILKKASTTLFL